MRKKIIEKGNLKKSDFLRTLVTDTTPEELPLVSANDGFYRVLSHKNKLSSGFIEILDAVLSVKRHTIPYRYNILNGPSSVRRLSLVHPGAQLKVCEFYAEYDTLICSLASKSTSSIRSPRKVGTVYYVRGFKRKKLNYKRSGIDTVDLERSVSGPASYFSYHKYRRAHEFFKSTDYINLEKKYEIFRMLDVNNCFGSIYTHSLFWATTDVKTAKRNISSKTFANDFDALMRQMNYNETNGICVGPEVSRVFAEIIFSRIDDDVRRDLHSKGLREKDDYECRRYVDDFYIFGRDEESVNKVQSSISSALLNYNLHLNSSKTETIVRPFNTRLSQIIFEIDGRIEEYFDKFLRRQRRLEESILVPGNINKPDSLLLSFINSIKAICLKSQVGYSPVSDYIISSVSNRIFDLCEGFIEGNPFHSSSNEDYIKAINILLETAFFYYTVNPTVRSSINLSKCIIISSRFIKAHFPDRSPFLAELLVRWTIELEKAVNRSSRHSDLSAVALEILNIMISVADAVKEDDVFNELIDSVANNIANFGYFEIISVLYMCPPGRRFGPLIDKLFKRSKDIIDESAGILMDSQSAHLFFDILSCPRIKRDKRASWLNSLRGSLGLTSLSSAASKALIDEMEKWPTFVRWQGVDLLSVLRKKELSSVY